MKNKQIAHNWVVTEAHDGNEVEVWNTYSYQHACAILCDYLKEDKEKLNPCVYYRLPDGRLTTEYNSAQLNNKYKRTI